MFPRTYKKQSKLKRLLLKLFNIYAFERETLNIVNPNYKNNSKNFFEINDKSFLLSSGYLDLKRKINSLDIFFRYSPSNSLWNSTDRWKRIIPNINKETLIKVCILSLKESISAFLKKNKINININLISDNSNDSFDEELKKILDSDNYKLNFYKSKIEGNRGSYLECCDQALKAKDIIFFIEDDYIFEKDSIEEIIFTYSRISTILNKDIFLCPSDYPFYYDSEYQTSLFIGKDFRWRYVNESLLTLIFSKSILNKYKNKIRQVGEIENFPFEKPFHQIFEQVPCLAPVNSLSYHLSRSVPAINENWIDLWNINYNKLKEL